ncbi:hypothetical protein ONS95_007556 [Cadophora gregata]|uniref:uncharacterized protein n=1 Tax=Cadophora gregata TaxID=51156 RepID=UPI0026DC98D7|nr:uncharacterized protein ONS95_007556 [Cadophora gregata]KAK0118673.1 hypothetical protein ONS96_011760 [Cadophora gregata f. sp. sojae]KAK0125932.1 hypothetical protein ONS95_007556 [Cadophora gregata]
MVTSRSQSRAARREDEVNEDNASHAYVSPGKKRKLRSAGNNAEDEEEVIATPSATKKRKTLPVREKDSSPAVAKTIPVVEIPAKKIIPEPEVQGGSQAKPIEIEDDVEERSDEDVSEEAVAEEGKSEEPEKVEVNTKTKHKKFGSEEPEPEFFSTAREEPDVAEEIADSEEGSNSEDDAPEAIGIQDAAKEIKSKERDTAKAVKDQLSASRKKRKERDEILKKQSSKSKKRQPVTTTAAPEQSSDSDNDAPSPSSQPENIQIPTHALTSRSALPSFLPAEYLEDDDDEDAQALVPFSDEITIIKKKAKKTKFIDAALKEPKDRRVGKTTYRVAKRQSTKLAPKSSFSARSTKEAWLQGRTGGKVDPSRRAFGKAFGRR